MAAIFDKNSDTKEIQTEIDNEVIADLLVSKEQSKKLQEKWEHAENMVNMVTGEHQKLSDVYESLRNTHLTTIEVLKNRKCLHCTSKPNKPSTNELAANFENLENSINLNKLQKQNVPRRTQSDSGEVPRPATDTSRPSSSVQDPKDANMMATKKRPLQENVPSSSLNATMNGMNEDRVINLKKPKPEPEDDDIMVVKEVRKNKDSRANKKVKVEDINGSKKTTATATFYVSPMQPISNPPTTTPPNFLPPATSMPNMHTTFAQIIPTITSITNTPQPSTSNFHQATNPQVFVVQPNGAYAQTPMNDAQARLMQHLYFQQAMQHGRPMHPQPVGTLLARKTPSGRRHPVPNVQVNNQQQDEYRDDVRACVDSYRDLSNLR
uniref:Uncharacterized protein n=1 Tax=Acrobeloides nanus TaxID=290746 RepID=A0A914CKG3_9BILA